MKLILCPSCGDVVKLRVVKWRSCDCGESHGRYLKDGYHAEIAGKAIAIGIINNSLLKALSTKDNFIAFVFKPDYHHIRKLDILHQMV